MIQSSAKVGTDGAAIASAGYHPVGWYAATVPSTVVGTLVDDGLYGDPFFGMNLRELSGTTFPIGANFVHTAMDPQSPYAVPWWYRTTFHVPSTMPGKRITLHFDGINYRANVWLNGRRLADSTAVVGTYRRYDFDITDALKSSAENALAVEVFAPTPPDLQTTWVDWNPSPPDKNMGLWHPVYVSARGDVAIEYPEVVSHVDTATLRSADLSVVTELRNDSSIGFGYAPWSHRGCGVQQAYHSCVARQCIGALHTGQLSEAPLREPTPLVACRAGNARAVRSVTRVRERRTRVRSAKSPVRHSRNHFRVDAQGRTSLSCERPAHFDPRWWLGARHVLPTTA